MAAATEPWSPRPRAGGPAHGPGRSAWLSPDAGTTKVARSKSAGSTSRGMACSRPRAARSAIVGLRSGPITVIRAPASSSSPMRPSAAGPATADQDLAVFEIEQVAQRARVSHGRAVPEMARRSVGHEPGGRGLVADGDPDPVRAETGEGLAAAYGEALRARRVRPDVTGRPVWTRTNGAAGRPTAGSRSPRARATRKARCGLDLLGRSGGDLAGLVGQAGGDGGQRRGRDRPRRLLRGHRGDHGRIAHRVAGAQTGEAPGLGQRPEHQHARSWSPPIMVSGSPGTASMNASSTTTIRPGRTSDAMVSARVQHAGRVGRVADHDQVGVAREPGPGRAGSRRLRAG